MTVQKENGYTAIANELMDALCKCRIPGEVRQVLDAIMRKTYGWNKKSDWISNSQLVEMTGLKKANVSRSLSKLITNRIVIKIDNKLSLNKEYKKWISFDKKLSKVITSVIKSDNKLLSKVMDTKTNKDTYTKDIGKTSKNSLTPCTEEELQEISSELGIALESVRNKHRIILNKIEAKEFKNKTVYRTLENWLIGDIEKGYLKKTVISSRLKGFHL